MATDIVAQWNWLLKEPTTPVQVNGETFHLHPTALRKSAFFADMLDLPGDLPNVELPCTTTEFVLLVMALYPCEDLGAVLPVSEFASAARLVSAADQIGVAELPALESVLLRCMQLPKDLAAAAALASAHPGLCGRLTHALPEMISRGVNDASDAQSWQQVWAALDAVRDCLDVEQLAAAAGERLRRPQCTSVDVEFVARIAAELLDVRQATRLFDAGFCASDEARGSFDAAVRTHLLRCAKECSLSEVTEPLSREQSEGRVLLTLVWDSVGQSVLSGALRASPPDQVELILSHLSHICPAQLVHILSVEVLTIAPHESQASLMEPFLHPKSFGAQDLEHLMLRKWATRHGKQALVVLAEPLRQTVSEALLSAAPWFPELAEVLTEPAHARL